MGLSGHVPEYDQNKQVWSLGIYSGAPRIPTRPSMTKTNRFGLRICSLGVAGYLPEYGQNQQV